VLDAQRAERAPRRPRLASGADTNDVNQYLNLGHRTIEDNASAAADAYYWAVRLDPSSADALYGLRMARLMRRPSTFTRYWEGQWSVISSDEMRANDSLQLRALWIDPFFHPRHQRTVQFVYFRVFYRGANSGDIDDYLMYRLERSGPAVRARVAVGAGQLGLAHTLYTEAIAASRSPAYLYIDRGAVNAMQGLNEPAIADYQVGLEELRKRDASRDSVVIFYRTKALYEHSSGLLHARHGNIAKAREALGRAMEEDLSFYPAHLALAQLALTEKDTATAVSEAALAADLAPQEAHVHFRQGEILLQVGEHAQAIAPLRKAIELEPFYAAPHFLLAQALEKASDETAKASYEKFVSLASRRDPRRAEANRRIAALGGGRE
jgi:tetratricopeptide (TPR) repeat protein